MKKARVSSQYLPVFCRELHQLVRAGIPIGEGLGMLREDEPDQAQRVWLDALYKDMEEGTPLSGALRRTEAFPSYMTDMIAMAEETGRLEDVLLSLSRHYDRQLRLAADIRGAIMVPLTLLAVMVAVVVLLVTQVLPVFDRVFAQLGVRMGGVATGMMNAGAVLARAGTGIGAAVVVLALAGIVTAAVPGLREGFAGWFRRAFGGRGVLGQIADNRFIQTSMHNICHICCSKCNSRKSIPTAWFNRYAHTVTKLVMYSRHLCPACCYSNRCFWVCFFNLVVYPLKH